MRKTCSKLGLLFTLTSLSALCASDGAVAHAAEPVSPPAVEAEVYLLAGQSNMLGAGQIKDLPADAKTPQAKVYFWNSKSFEPLIPGKTVTGVKPGNFGPEIGFSAGLRQAKPNTPIYLLKFAIGGQPLHYGWKKSAQWVGAPPGPNRVNFYPGKSPDDPDTGLLYLQMRERFKQALAALDATKVPHKIRGVLWMQGEADARHPVAAADYAEMLRLLKSRLEQDFKTPNLPLVYGQALPFSPPVKHFVARDKLRQQMQDADHRSGKPAAIPGVWMVPTDGFPLLQDHIHYNADGQWRLGSAFAKTMLDALSTTKPNATGAK